MTGRKVWFHSEFRNPISVFRRLLVLIDRTHKPWFFASVLALAVTGSAYWAVSKGSLHSASGGSVFGLLLGIFGSLMMVFAALLAVRKRLPTWRVGSAQLWLRGHLWLGTLGFVLILFHAGFKWGGLLENLLWVSFGLVVVTGFAGVLLQQVIPRLLTTRVPLETMVAQIPFLSQTMQFRADQLIAKQAGLLDVDFESLKPFAEEVLKQQRVLKRESDFPKELAKVYANVSLPDAESKTPPTIVPAEIISTKPASPAKVASPSPLPPGEGGRRPGEGSGTDTPATSPVTSTEATPAPKPKSPLELMREKAAAKAAEGGPPNTAAEPVKKLSPIEQMRAKAAAAQAAEPTADTPAPVADAPPPVPEKKLSPIELMRAKQAAKTASVAEASPAVAEVAAVEPAAAVPAAEPEKKLSPIELMRAKLAAKSAPVASTPAPLAESPAAAAAATDVAPEKKLSPLEQMKAKLAAAKPASTDSSAETHKPLTIEKPAAATKPTVAKPAVEKPVATAPAKSVAKPAAPIPPALLAVLKDFHLRVVRPFLNNGRSPQYRLDDDIAARRVFAQLRSDLPTELHDVLLQLQNLCDERRQFNTQLRLHRWMHWWLILHIPPSIALMVLFVAHVIVSLRVVPFGK